MHPSADHLLPFFIAAGASHSTAPTLARRLHTSTGWGGLGMDAYAFGSWAQKDQTAGFA